MWIFTKHGLLKKKKKKKKKKKALKDYTEGDPVRNTN
jgi:hypothetical protein